MSKTCLAAVAREARAPFTLEEVRVDPPRAGEIAVRIAGVGFCHTDLVFRDSVAAFAKPAVLGHEGAGVVEALGDGVTDIAIGDRVMLSFSSCGACRQCGAGLPSYCSHFVPLNYAGLRLGDGSKSYSLPEGVAVSSHFFGQSSFAAIAIARASSVVKVPVDTKIPLALLGTLGCGFQTGAGAVLRSLDAAPGSTLLVFGGGPVGLAAIMAGRIRGCREILLVEPIASRRAVGLDLGATHVIDPAEAADLAATLRARAPGGVDTCLDTTGIASVIEAGLATLAPHGAIGLVGVPGEAGASIKVDIAALMTPGHRIFGIIEGDSDPRQFLPELLQYHAEGRFPFDRLIRTYPFAQINEAIVAQMRGDCIKAVLVPDADATGDNQNVQ